jgi:Ca-activated chloride channel family protein
MIAAAIAALVMAGAELLHAARTRRVAALAFGPSRQPLLWARLAPLARIVAVAGVMWGLVTLYFLPSRAHKAGVVKPHEIRRLVLILDVSPSMKLADAGVQQKQRRDQRAAEILTSFFDRVQKDRYRTSIIAVYSEAKPVVKDTTDLEVVHNILTELPLSQAFKSGETNLFAGIEQAVELAKPWPPQSTILMIVSDGGDPVPGGKFPKLPASIGHVIVVGVGSPTTGKFIDGVLSRQDVPSLRQAAARLKGTYYNANESHLPTELVREVSQPSGNPRGEDWTLREWALFALATGSTTLAVLPVLLQVAGTMWRPGRRS